MDVREFDRARSALHSLDPGAERAEWVRAGIAAKAAGLDFEDFHDWSAGAGNYRNEADVSAVWRSIREDGGIQAGTLFGMARAAGWSDEAPRQTHQNRPLRTTERRTHEVPPKAPALDVAALWASCAPATAEHGYIVRKHGLPAGLRVYDGPLTIAREAVAGCLVVPCYSIDGTLRSAQFIPPADGKKLNAPGLPMDGLFVVGRIPHQGAGATLYLCEGIGQAWSCHQAANAPAVVCFGSGRMESASKALAGRYPLARRVLVADAGKEQHCARIAKDTAAGWIEMPTGSRANFDANDLHQRDGLDALAALLANPKEHPRRFRLLAPSELVALPPVRWRVRGVLPERGIAALYGPSGSGKSFLALDLLAAVAAGRPWFGRRVKPAPVTYVALEGEAGISQRIQAHQDKHGPLAAGFRFLLQALDIRKPADRADLVAAARAAGCVGGVLAIDTLNRAAPGADENDSAAMGEIIAATKALQAELGGLVLLVHHTGKDASKGLRGHSSLHAALDAAVEVSRSDDRREWTTAKSKDGSDDQGNPFRLEIVEIGTDDDGEEITSCYVVPEENAADAVRRALPPKSGNQRTILDALRDILKANGERRPDGVPAQLPMGRPVVRLEDAIEQTRTRLVCEPKRQTERAQAAIRGLAERGILVHVEGWLWLA
jgi:hypothetical protein